MTLDRPSVDRRPAGATAVANRSRTTKKPALRGESSRANVTKRRRVLTVACLVLAASSVTGFSFFVGARGPSYLDRLVWVSSLDSATPAPADFVAQQGDSDCGPASLKMILDHHGFHTVTLEEIESATAIGPQGTSLLALKKISENQGLRSRGLQLSVEKLADLPMPAIAHVHGDHFVVLRSIDASGVVVDDPSIGRLRMSSATFGRAWDGVVLVFDPDTSGPAESVQPSDKPNRVAA